MLTFRSFANPIKSLDRGLTSPPLPLEGWGLTNTCFFLPKKQGQISLCGKRDVWAFQKPRRSRIPKFLDCRFVDQDLELATWPHKKYLQRQKLKASCPDFGGYNNLPATKMCWFRSHDFYLGGFFEVMGRWKGWLVSRCLSGPGCRLQGFNKQRMIWIRFFSCSICWRITSWCCMVQSVLWPMLWVW